MCKFIFGITGGSGSGKTTVSDIFRSLGADVIDTDIISRCVTGKGSECLLNLTAALGKDILTEDGSLNRRRLASIAFADNEKKSLLNTITHKYIKLETEKRITESPSNIIGIDGAVLIGSNMERMCEKMVVVTAERNVRINRIKSRDNLTDEEAITRLDAQQSDEFYKSHADFIIDNSSDLASLTEQVKTVYNKLKGE